MDVVNAEVYLTGIFCILREQHLKLLVIVCKQPTQLCIPGRKAHTFDKVDLHFKEAAALEYFSHVPYLKCAGFVASTELDVIGVAFFTSKIKPSFLGNF